MTRTSTHQSEALIFANDRPTSLDDDLYQWSIDAEDLIRHQHARIAELEDVADMAIKRIAELEAQLSAIGAGGVSGPLMGIEKAEARRAALEAITPKLQAIYDLWDTLYVAALPINSVNADYEQLDSEAAALLAQSIGVSVSTLGSGLQYLANVFQLLDRPSKDLLEALKPNEEARQARAALAATPAAQVDAKDAARYRWLRDNDWRNDEKMEPVIRLQLNAIWDVKIDEALAAQAKHGEAQQ